MGKIGPSYLFSENGDLSFLLHFLIQFLVGNIQEKFQKFTVLLGNFYFRGITLIACALIEINFSLQVSTLR